MLSFAVLLVCHNRRELTLRALDSLHRANLPHQVKLAIVLFDDASTDGTSAAVKAAYPETLIVHGGGSAFWNGGLNEAWKAALPLPVDGFIWLNDDVDLLPDCITTTMKYWHEAFSRTGNRRFIVAGATLGDKGEFTHGGKRLAPTPWALRIVDVAPTDKLEKIDSFNGNYVVIPREVVDLIGLNDPAFFHNFGDIDYGLRATKAGVSVFLMPKAVGICPFNPEKTRNGFGSPLLSLFQQWRKVNTHHGLPFKSWARMTMRHSGIWFPFHFLLAYRRLILPRWLLKRLPWNRQLPI